MRRYISVLVGLGILAMVFAMGFSGAQITSQSNLAVADVSPSHFAISGPIAEAPVRSQIWAPELIDPAISEVATSAPAAAGCRPVSPLSPACPEPEPAGRAVGVLVGIERWRPLVERYFESDDVDLAMKVMACESGGNPTAANPTSSARGLFQHLGSFWNKRAASAGRPGADIFDPEANVAVAAWLVYHQGGWKHWNASASCW